jgi:hypothetical protein
MSGRGLARAQNKRANRGTKKKEIRPVTQSRWLLTVIHNPMQEYFLGLNSGMTTRCGEGRNRSAAVWFWFRHSDFVILSTFVIRVSSFTLVIV